MEFFCSHEQKRKFQEQKIPRIFEVTLVVLTPLYISRDCLIPQLQNQPMEKERGMA